MSNPGGLATNLQAGGCGELTRRLVPHFYGIRATTALVSGDPRGKPLLSIFFQAGSLYALPLFAHPAHTDAGTN